MRNYEEEKLLKVLKGETNLTAGDNYPENQLIIHLMEQGQLTFNQLSALLTTYFKIETLEHISQIDEEMLMLFDKEDVKRLNMLPYQMDDKVHVATANPFDPAVDAFLKRYADKKPVKTLMSSDKLMHLIDYFYKGSTYEAVENNEIESIIDSFLSSAILQNASDIHIENFKTETRIRFRIDGALKINHYIDKKIIPNIVSRLKIISNLDIADNRIPKDGAFKLEKYPAIDFRISTLPTLYGEKVVIRLIYKEVSSYDLADPRLGFSSEEVTKIKALLNNTTGVILVTGATGSGKSTTLSSFLTYLNDETRNIVTVEDPVEHVISGVNHVNINPKINIGFDTILKNILRQDPDIIMIGEIRDKTTAKMVIEASLTGHLCLTTLHTNDAISSVYRLVDMGIEQYLLTEAIKGVVSQRLVRRLCSCKVPVNLPQWVAENYQLDKQTIIYDKSEAGCKLCYGSGYKGRFAICELLVFTEDVRAVFATQVDKARIRQQLTTFESLEQKAINCVVKGETSLHEIYSIIMSQG